MRVYRKQCEHGGIPDEQEDVSNGSWKDFSEVQDDCNIQEERLDEANDTRWEVHDSVVDESTSADDEDCHDQKNEVHELKEVEVRELQIAKEQIVPAALTNIFLLFSSLNEVR